VFCVKNSLFKFVQAFQTHPAYQQTQSAHTTFQSVMDKQTLNYKPVPNYVAYDTHLASCTLKSVFPHNMTCRHNTMFTETN